MAKCPYCNNMLELKLEVAPTPIDDKFKDDLIQAYLDMIDIQADVIPFGGKMLKKMAQYAVKFTERYFDKIGAVPLLLYTCSKCDAVISSERLFDLFTSQSSGSS